MTASVSPLSCGLQSFPTLPFGLSLILILTMLVHIVSEFFTLSVGKLYTLGSKEMGEKSHFFLFNGLCLPKLS